MENENEIFSFHEASLACDTFESPMACQFNKVVPEEEEAEQQENYSDKPQLNHKQPNHHEEQNQQQQQNQKSLFFSSLEIMSAAQENISSRQQKYKDSEAQQWKLVLESAINSIVSIRYIICRSLDTWTAGTYTATGFIVDAEQGLILTNKHVTTDAPFIGKICFKNSEETPAWPIWRDPVHDFGILKFDPSKIKFMKLKAIPLVPEGAQVGTQVKVPGSDAGEKLAVLSGIIARTDRQAPNYSKGKYCDFNTFYIQASANTSGGSSGSPVIDIHGQAVALNAGGTSKAASSFFLPLQRIKRAVDLIRQGEKPTRGTIQTEFVQKHYDECRRLGLPMDLESKFRELNHELNGILAVKSVIPGGPAHSALRSGDLLIQCDGQYVNHFVDLAECLDGKVKSTQKDVKEEKKDESDKSIIELCVFRGKKLLNLKVKVQDLESIVPNSFIEFSGCIVHPLSYQVARHYMHPVGVVFLSNVSNEFCTSNIPAHSVIVSVAHKAVPDIDTFVQVMKSLPCGQRVPVRFYCVAKKNIEVIRIVMIDHNEGPMKFVKRNDEIGLWNSSEIECNTEYAEPASAQSRFALLARNQPQSTAKLLKRVAPSICTVTSTFDYGIDGFGVQSKTGTGIILDAEKGIIVVEREIVPITALKIYVTITNNHVIPAEILWIHPVACFVFIEFDVDYLKKIVGKEKYSQVVRPIELSDLPEMEAADDVHLVTLNQNTHLPRILKTQVKTKGYFSFPDVSPPKYRPMNWDYAVVLCHRIKEETGVIVDNEGKARGLWFSVYKTMLGYTVDKSSDFRFVFNCLLEGELPMMRMLDVELTETYYYKARIIGLSDEWINKIDDARIEKLNGGVQESKQLNGEGNDDDGVFYGSDKYSVVTVKRIPAVPTTRKDEKFLMEGDLILSITNKTATTAATEAPNIISGMRQLYELYSPSHPLQTLASKQIKMTVLRDGQEIELDIPLKDMSGEPQLKVVYWGGSIFQMPHRAIYFHVKQIPVGIYVSLMFPGTPCQRDDVRPTWFVTEVDGKKIHSLEGFLEAVEGENWRETVQKCDLPTSKPRSVKSIPKGNKENQQLDLKSNGGEDKTNSLSSPFENKSFKFNMVSLEHAVKVVTVDINEASKRYFPTWIVDYSASIDTPITGANPSSVDGIEQEKNLRSSNSEIQVNEETNIESSQELVGPSDSNTNLENEGDDN